MFLSSNFSWASFCVDEAIQIVFLYSANVVLHTNKMKRKYNVVYFLKSNISCTTLLIYGWKSLNVFYYVMYMILIDLMRIENTNFLRILFYLYGFVDIQITFLGNLNHAWEKYVENMMRFGYSKMKRDSLHNRNQTKYQNSK